MYSQKNNYEYILDKEESEKCGGVVLIKKSKYKEYTFDKIYIDKDIIFKIRPIYE